MKTEYITPTKERPVFVAYCNAFGCIDKRMYKSWNVKNDKTNSVGDTFALSFADAVNSLHEWIKDHAQFVVENPKCKFIIQVINGVTKYDDVVFTDVYEISASKAKKYII